MRIHSNIIGRADLDDAAGAAGVTVRAATPHGSRRRERAWEVLLTGSGRTGTAWRSDPSGPPSATWDEWGMFLAAIFGVDENAIAGPYLDAYDFHAVTCGRFESLTPAHASKRHAWRDYSDARGDFGTIGCTTCEARIETQLTTSRRRAGGESVL